MQPFCQSNAVHHLASQLYCSVLSVASASAEHFTIFEHHLHCTCTAVHLSTCTALLSNAICTAVTIELHRNCTALTSKLHMHMQLHMVLQTSTAPAPALVLLFTTHALSLVIIMYSVSENTAVQNSLYCIFLYFIGHKFKRWSKTTHQFGQSCVPRLRYIFARRSIKRGGYPSQGTFV